MVAIVTLLDVSTYWPSLDVRTDGLKMLRGHIERPKPAIVEASVSAAMMIDISESIGASCRINGEDDREADREVDCSTGWLPNSLGSDRRARSQPIAGSTCVGSRRVHVYANARVNVVPP